MAVADVLQCTLFVPVGGDNTEKREKVVALTASHRVVTTTRYIASSHFGIIVVLDKVRGSAVTFIAVLFQLYCCKQLATHHLAHANILVSSRVLTALHEYDQQT